MKQQVFSKQQSVLSVVFNCLFSGALSPPSRVSSVLQVLSLAKKKYCPVLSLSVDHVNGQIQGTNNTVNTLVLVHKRFLLVLICGKVRHLKALCCMCISGTVSLGCPWTTKSRTFPAQMWPTCCWRTSLSGLTMRLRWLPTMGQVWALSAIRSLSGLCREVSTHIGVKNQLIC